MPQCKICSTNVTTGVVLHSECFEAIPNIVRCSECVFNMPQGTCLHCNGLKNTSIPNAFCCFGAKENIVSGDVKSTIGIQERHRVFILNFAILEYKKHKPTHESYTSLDAFHSAFCEINDGYGVSVLPTKEERESIVVLINGALGL